MTGCARSEGYYAISRKEKDVYLDLDLAEAMQESVDYDISVCPHSQRELLSLYRTHLLTASLQKPTLNYNRWMFNIFFQNNVSMIVVLYSFYS